MTTYHCICRVCDREQDVEADFLSVGFVRVMPDGSERLVVNCRDERTKHTPQEVREAWERSMAQ